MKKAIVPISLIILITCVICYMVASEYKQKGSSGRKTEEADENFVEEANVISDDALIQKGTVILIAKDTKENKLTLRNILGGKAKELAYDGTTQILSRHGEALTADELPIGEILEITFSTHNARLASVKISDNAWSNEKIDKFIIDEEKKTLSIGEDLFELDDNIVVASGDETGELMDITSLDTITLRGFERKIYSIIINSGHGYIRVLNDSYFVGGWIEIGKDIIKPVSEEMLIPVPEGQYTVKVTHKGYLGKEDLTVKRDEETLFDLSKIEIEEVAVGHVQFNLTPDFAQLFIDGEMTDFEERVPLEYGIHRVHAEQAGYIPVDINIKVGSEFANIDIELDMDKSGSSASTSASSKAGGPESADTSSSSGSSSSSSSSTELLLTDNKKIYVEGPAGAEVYLDGTYIGVAPCSAIKVTGQHVITLSKSGYETKSYTINVENDGKDLTISFSELTAKE